MKTKLQVVADARALIGVPFRHQGRLPSSGLDCLGLVFLAAGCDFDETGYSPLPTTEQMSEGLQRAPFTRIPVDDAVPGDILRFSLNGRAVHLAIKTDYGVVHAITGHAVAEHRLDRAWTEKIVEAYQINGVS